MAEKSYSVTKTIVKGCVPLLIPIISEAVSAAANGSGIPVSKTAVYSGVTAFFGFVVGFKNWIKNRKK